uniref:Uncharacterized protein n=1 Tax=Rhizophora mucronata TaxID=61149 RepID=A0A2P2Q6P8_RHIMU
MFDCYLMVDLSNGLVLYGWPPFKRLLFKLLFVWLNT